MPKGHPGKPALLSNMRQATRFGAGQRTLKMVAPRCDICQAGKAVPWNWYERCKHDPYVTVVPIKTTNTKYEDVVDDEGKPTGAKRVTGTETIVEYEARPNWVEVAQSPRINGGRGYHRARRKGRILPIDVRAEAFPNGVAPVCQYRGCYSQKGLKEYKTGVFCREEEARLVWFDQEGKVLEYPHPFDVESDSKRKEMLERASI